MCLVCPKVPAGMRALNMILCMQVLQDAGAVQSLEEHSECGLQCRPLPSAHVNRPLAVSVARALVAVCATQRITVFDMNEDEDAASGSDFEEDEEGGDCGPEDSGQEAMPADD